MLRLVMLALSLVLRAPAAAAIEPEAAKRLLTLLTAVGEEYREGLDNTGELVRPLEYEEARSFLAEARVRWQQAAADDAGEVAQQLAALGAAIETKAGAEQVLEQLEAVRRQIRVTAGVSEEIYPPEAPSAARGAAVFREHCVACHGARGDGQGPEAARLERKPADFTDPQFMRGETPYDFFHVISAGKRGAAMPAWQDVLSVQERWDVLAHVWRLGQTPAQLAQGQGVYLSQCAGCHGAGGDGNGSYAPQLLTPVADLTEPARLAQRTEAELFDLVRNGVAGTAMPAFRNLTEDERWSAIAFLRLLSLGGPGGGSGPAPPSTGAPASQGAAAASALAETRRLLAAALAAYRARQPQTLALVSDAYFEFEPSEKPLAVRAPGLTRQIEARFLELRALVSRPDAEPQVAGVIAAIEADLETASAAMAPQSGSYALFAQSATIILREGFEVVLIIGALVAYVVKSGNPHMQRSILLGAGAGLAGSVLTAYGLLSLLHGTAGPTAETLEGVTMLLATAVLFWVSYWLISKVQAEKWQRYIQGKVQAALSRGSVMTLAGAAFLAVYREGVETVLFYRALVGSADGAIGAIAGGLAAGAALLAGLYLTLRRFGLRLPIKPFFVGTSALLYGMALGFAGNGIAELQEAGWIALTPVAGVPRVEFLGLHPTLETLLAQGALVALVIYAGASTLRRRAARPSPLDNRPPQTGARIAEDLRLAAGEASPMQTR
ncbi:MAG: c-type cytochrome [Deltaproteobacteria bacterium]|nr:c-type cytochrome [Deltaproteobacteria bacterium]